MFEKKHFDTKYRWTGQSLQHKLTELIQIRICLVLQQHQCKWLLPLAVCFTTPCLTPWGGPILVGCLLLLAKYCSLCSSTVTRCLWAARRPVCMRSSFIHMIHLSSGWIHTPEICTDACMFTSLKDKCFLYTCRYLRIQPPMWWRRCQKVSKNVLSNCLLDEYMNRWIHLFDRTDQCVDAKQFSPAKLRENWNHCLWPTETKRKCYQSPWDSLSKT